MSRGGANSGRAKVPFGWSSRSMFVTRSGPRISTQPFVTVDLPAPESPTRQSRIGRPARNGSGAALLITGLVGLRVEDAARADVCRVDAGEIVAGDGPPVRDEA